MGSNDTIYEIIGLDSEDSSSSSSSQPSVFAASPFVLEVHEMKREDPEPPANADLVTPLVKAKKIKKKKNPNPANKTSASASSESVSSAESTTVPKTERIEESNREEFYDAHESYHTLPANQQTAVAAPPTAATPVVGANLVVAQSITGQQELKVETPAQPTDQGQSVEERQPSTISKRPEK